VSECAFGILCVAVTHDSFIVALQNPTQLTIAIHNFLSCELQVPTSPMWAMLTCNSWRSPEPSVYADDDDVHAHFWTSHSAYMPCGRCRSANDIAGRWVPQPWRYRKLWGHPWSDHSIQCHSLKAASWNGWGDETKADQPADRRSSRYASLSDRFFNEFYVNIPTCVRSEEPPSLTPSTPVAISSHTWTTTMLSGRGNSKSRCATIACHKEQTIECRMILNCL